MSRKRGPYKTYLHENDDDFQVPRRSKSRYNERDGQHFEEEHNADDNQVEEEAAEDDQNQNFAMDVQNYQDIGNERVLVENDHVDLMQHVMREEQSEEELGDDEQSGSELDGEQAMQHVIRDEQSEEEVGDDEQSGSELDGEQAMQHVIRDEQSEEELGDDDQSGSELDGEQARGQTLVNTAVGFAHNQNQNNPRLIRAEVEQEDTACGSDEVEGNAHQTDEEDVGWNVYSENEENEEDQEDIPEPDPNRMQLGDQVANDVNREEDRQMERPPADHDSHSELKKIIRSENFTSPISAQVRASPAEALLMTLTLAEKNQLTLKAFVDSVKLLNSLFSAPVIPNTLYLLDKLLHSCSGIKRFFYCDKCSFSFGIRDSSIEPTLKCPECEFVNKITDLTKATYLVVFPLQNQIELLLKDVEIKKSLVSPKEVVQGRDPDELCDLYDGKMYKEFADSLEEDDNNSIVISLTGNTDGTPLFKSSNYSIWPFFVSVNELPPAVRMKHLLLGGLWFGSKKPPMDLYLEHIKDHLIELASGFTLKLGFDNDEETSIKAFMIGLCVDSGARGAVQGINTHSGYYACNWCEIPGEYDNKVIFPFPEVPPQRRTHESIVEHARECLQNGRLQYVYGVQYLSPLATLPKFDIVNGMILDYAHNMLFGLSRTMLDEWLSNTSRGCYIGAPDDLVELDSKIMKITPPIEVRRPVRKISDRSHWNMREFENWTLTYSIPVLTDILPSKYLVHWTYLVQVLFLLSRQKISKENIETAHRLALHFSRDAEYLYGKSVMSYNLHIFSHHLADNVLRWGPLWAINTFSFESGNKDLKGLLHAQHGVPHQIHRALSYKQATSILKISCGTQKTKAYEASIASKVNKMSKYVPVAECALIGTSKLFVPTDEENFILNQCGFDIDLSNCMKFLKVIAGKCVYVSSDSVRNKKFDNGCAVTVDNKVISIRKFILDQSSEKVYLFCNEMSVEPFLRVPQGIRIPPKDHCIREILLVGRRLHLISIQKLRSVGSVTRMNDKMYVSEFPNVHNIF